MRMSHTLTVRDVAAILVMSTDRVKQLDDELHPVREPNGWRRYAPEDVERVRVARARKAGR